MTFILLHLFGMGLLDVINDVWIGDTTRITGHILHDNDNNNNNNNNGRLVHSYRAIFHNLPQFM
jgi:hypothetical protein